MPYFACYIYNLSVIVMSFPGAIAPEPQFQWTEVEMHISSSVQVITRIMIHSLIQSLFTQNNNDFSIPMYYFSKNNMCDKCVLDSRKQAMGHKIALKISVRIDQLVRCSAFARYSQ